MKEWIALEACALSGQIDEADLVKRLNDEPELKAWWLDRARLRKLAAMDVAAEISPEREGEISKQLAPIPVKEFTKKRAQAFGQDRGQNHETAADARKTPRTGARS